MPYASPQTGVYRLVNRTECVSYVGSTSNLQKRRAEHFRLLRHGRHPNRLLQAAFTRYGEATFDWVDEVACVDLADAREIELATLRGDLSFEESAGYNIARDAFPMMGRTHSASTKERISQSKSAGARPLGAPARQKLQDSQRTRRFADPAHAARVQFIMDNDRLSYAERARYVGLSLSTARKLYLRYASDYGKRPPPTRPSYDRGVAPKLEYIRAHPEKTLKAVAQDLGCSATSISALVRRYQLR